MLYETCARAEETLPLDIEDLTLPFVVARSRPKGAIPITRRGGAARDQYVLQTVYWDAGTARLLPRLLTGRTHGPVFTTRGEPAPGKPGPGKVCDARGVCLVARFNHYKPAAIFLREQADLGPDIDSATIARADRLFTRLNSRHPKR
ncbi:hypothetical protein C8250_034630 [Streptomyces sp. So13.3]|uniref:hypothetical protein n=1 Tax=Streptomyces TaxID=1883 RepID=UPI0011072373|nr:hypothetical protein C8250_034630 [Streptomyces sp. So13.3]